LAQNPAPPLPAAEARGELKWEAQVELSDRLKQGSLLFSTTLAGDARRAAPVPAFAVTFRSCASERYETRLRRGRHSEPSVGMATAATVALLGVAPDRTFRVISPPDGSRARRTRCPPGRRARPTTALPGRCRPGSPEREHPLDLAVPVTRPEVEVKTVVDRLALRDTDE
jgi:hypothetical protein